MNVLLNDPPRYLFFTGKGGVGKTSLACAAAVALADRGRRVLLASTDPASNLDEVLQTPLANTPTGIPAVPGLSAVNVDPIVAAREYRERVVGPYRGVLPEAAVRQIEEQLSGACTVEIAGFSEFARLLGDDGDADAFDHVILDTAPTGHTLRMLNLPAAWNDFIATNRTGSSCLGPLAGLDAQRALFARVVDALKDPGRTLLVLVARAESMTLREAQRTNTELAAVGMANQHLVINGIFETTSSDPVARAFAEKSRRALAAAPPELLAYPTTRVPFAPAGVTGVAALRALWNGSDHANTPSTVQLHEPGPGPSLQSGWTEFVDGLASAGRGVIMTMGKGGVGKTTMAALIAGDLARRGHEVLLSTTDPAAHVAELAADQAVHFNVERIDPRAETVRYVDAVLAANRETLSPEDLELLEEELRSPCTEEIAVFQAFAETVARGRDGFVVLDTAPTGHTLLLLDATRSYHRQVARTSADVSPAVRSLLPSIRDPGFTRVVVVTLPETTPVHEAAALQDDLRRAGIQPYGWIVNRCFSRSGTSDPMLLAKARDERVHIDEVTGMYADPCVLFPWADWELDGMDAIARLSAPAPDKEYREWKTDRTCAPPPRQRPASARGYRSLTDI